MREERSIDSAIRKALGRRTAGAASSCPDENLLAAYLERSLSDQERLHLEGHFSDCASCRELLALSMRVAADEPGPMEDSMRSSQERKLFSHSRVPLAVVAVLVLGIGTALIFLLTGEFRKAEHVEVAEQRAPAAAPAAENLPAQTTRNSSVEQPKPAQPSAPGAASVQTAKARIDSGRMSTAKEMESRAEEELQSPPVYQNSLESKQKVPSTDRVALNETAPGPAGRKDESVADVTAVRGAGEAGGGRAAGASVGGVVAGVPASGRSAEERAAEGVVPQTAAVAVDSRDLRREALSQPAKLALNSQRAMPSPALLDLEETRLRDVLQRAAADAKAGKTVHWATRIIGDRTFKHFGGCWIDMKVLGSPDVELVECSPGSPEREEIGTVLPAIEGLRQSGQPILLSWKGRTCVMR
jgi:hypothetical protein